MCRALSKRADLEAKLRELAAALAGMRRAGRGGGMQWVGPWNGGVRRAFFLCLLPWSAPMHALGSIVPRPPPPPPAEDMAEEGLRGKTLTLKLKLTSFEVGRVWGGAVERQGEGQGQRACSIVPCSGLHAMCWLGWCARQRA